MVDTCAAEFAARTPYYYSTYDTQCELVPSSRKKVLILGSGPIRIGQGIEFDYCTVHAVMALREQGIEAHIVNNNPETVSTDYDTSDKLFFEPVTLEDVMNIIEKEQPYGVLVQFGGQTAINLAIPLEKEIARRGLQTKILGTSPDSIDLAEDRERFNALMNDLNIPQPQAGIAYSPDEAKAVAAKIGYPVLVRPSYVLGGRAMEIVYDETGLEVYMREAVRVSREHPVLIDDFLQDAVEIDVDAVCDGKDVLIGAIMEHIEEAGIHSGDSACMIPPQTLPGVVLEVVRDYVTKDRPGPECGGHCQPADGLQGRDGLCAGGQSPIQPDHTLRLQVGGPAPGQDCGQCHDRQIFGRAGLHPGAQGALCLGQGGAAALRQASRRGCAAGAGDEVHGRGHGHRLQPGPGLLQGGAVGGQLPAPAGHGLHLGQGRGQGGGYCGGQEAL